MAPRVTFVDLPVELGEHIVLLAGAMDDKTTLANLTRVSRAIHATVQPIFEDIVHINAANISRICATSHAFTSTRRLLVTSELGYSDRDLLDCLLESTQAFRKVEMFLGPFGVLHSLLSVCSPIRVVLTAESRRLDNRHVHTNVDWTPAQVQNLSRITHVRGKDAYLLPRRVATCLHGPDNGLSARNLALLPSLSHLVLEPWDAGDLHQYLCYLPMLLRGLPKLERILICLTPPIDQTKKWVLAFARDFPAETRVWSDGMSAHTDDDPYAVFEDEHWFGGEQVRIPVGMDIGELPYRDYVNVLSFHERFALKGWTLIDNRGLLMP